MLKESQIAIIIPCYNESLRLQNEKFLSFAKNNPVYDLWFVNDGSKDDTLNHLLNLQQLLPEKIFVHNLSVNAGKSEAVRKVMLLLSEQNQYQYIGFIDADLSAPLEEIPPLCSVISEQQLLIASGARVKLVGKNIKRNAKRHYFGRIFATYYDTLLKLGNYDTQCGLKIFESKFASRLFEQPFVSSWFFDIELFVRARHLIGAENYGKRIAEIPLNEWKEVKGSKLKLTDFLKAPFEVLNIYKKYKNTK